MRRISWGRFFAACVAASLASVSLAAGPAEGVGGFGDVAADEFYADSVQWMVDEGLTTGTSPGCFSPDRPMTRGELGTFIWRYAGTPDGGPHPFSDVQPTAFYADAVRWMYSAHVTTGTSPTTFSPERLITRGEVATFLWRYDGTPPAPPSPFVDVPSTAFYADAVNWMDAEGITTGTSPTMFSPLREVTRAEFATFLYRYSGSPPVQDSGGGTCGETGQKQVNLDAAFVETFESPSSLDRFQWQLQHVAPSVESFSFSWQGDHDLSCAPPTTSRDVHVVTDNVVFPNGMGAINAYGNFVYWCAPGGDLGKAHMMTSFNTPNFAQISFSPSESFVDVGQVCWDQNLTDLGGRKWTSLTVVPEATYQANDARIDYTAGGAVGQHGVFGTGDVFRFTMLRGSTEVSSGGNIYDVDFRGFVTLVKARRFTTCIKDLENGTVEITLERAETTDVRILDGYIPDGPVRVIFQDETYNPEKDPAPVTNPFTWHWDNIVIETASD